LPLGLSDTNGSERLISATGMFDAAPSCVEATSDTTSAESLLGSTTVT
jgi:hypothetical protein